MSERERRLPGWQGEPASDDLFSPGLIELIRRIAETIEALRARRIAEALGELLGHRQRAQRGP